MLRKTLLLSVLLCGVSLQLAEAQSPANLPPSHPAANEPATLAPPALFQLAQNDRQTLAERLQAIRGLDSTDQRTSSRRTTSRAPQPSPTANTPSSLEPTPDTVLDDAAARAKAPDLPSVLVRRGDSPNAPAPVTDATDLATVPKPKTPNSDLPLSARTTQPPALLNVPRAPGQTWQAADSSANAIRTARAPVAAPATTPAVDNAMLILSEQVPALRLETIGPKAISVGKAATYRIRMVNPGSIAARQIEVTAILDETVEILAANSRVGTVDHQTDPAGARQVKWLLDTVSANSQHELTLQLKVTVNKPLDLKVQWTHRPASITARVTVQQPQLMVNVDGPSEMRFGETKVFRVRLSNPGNGPADEVAVNISATGVNSQPKTIGTLAAGESRVLELEMTAAQAGMMQIHALRAVAAIWRPRLTCKSVSVVPNWQYRLQPLNFYTPEPQRLIRSA